MIVDNQKNLKVHFAGLENSDFSICLSRLAGVNYALFTVFPFIAQKFGIKPCSFKSCSKDLINRSIGKEYFRHSIMDSGLFTLMFGAHAGKRDEKFVERWMNEIASFVNEICYTGTIVEVDCQKILGVNKAWEFREKLKKLVTNRIINVFHVEDGKNGLDRMIEYSDYIAISVPELRIVKKDHKTETIKLANYIKSKKPSIDIHLLGCTESKLLKQLSFCTTSDSTSWQSMNRYGSISIGQVRAHVKNMSNKKILGSFKDKIKKNFDEFGLNVNLTDKSSIYYGRYILCASELRKFYQSLCGDQS